ncbi:MAG: hypothetical protein PHI27_13395, partial [Eubacteriales bacterium]|nr:hypothetical protein [Eubacteriales bacterium]
ALGSLLSVALSSAPAKREQYITIRRGRTTTKQILYLTWGTLHYVSCKQPGICAICSSVCNNSIRHNNDYTVCLFDETSHWYKCKDCGENASVQPHISSCKNPDVCEECGAKNDENNINHKYDWDNIEFNEETHWLTCADCEDVMEWNHAASCVNPGVCTICGIQYSGENTEHNYSGDAYCYDEKSHTICRELITDSDESKDESHTNPIATEALEDAVIILPEGAEETEINVNAHELKMTERLSEATGKTILRAVTIDVSQDAGSISSEGSMRLSIPVENGSVVTNYKGGKNETKPFILTFLREDGTVVEIDYIIENGQIIFETNEVGIFLFIAPDMEE